MLESAGPEAAEVIMLWWVLFGVAAVVLLIVTGFLLVGCFRNVPQGESAESGNTLGRTLIIGAMATVVLLLILLVATYEQSQPFAEEPDDALTIQVRGKLWWWAVDYLDEDGEKLFETANEIHVPVGVPVRLRLVSNNVIHSFWVPKLGGKMDMVPGRTNHLWLQADQPGSYRGQCAEFCGIQHAKMGFFVVATSADDFADWMAAQQRSAAEPQSDLARQGREVFRTSGCTECHTIRGVPAPSRTDRPASHWGPDLTHLASRQSLAAGALPNRRGHLGGWIADPQSVKPGSLMPSFPLPVDDFHALLHYLETLE